MRGRVNIMRFDVIGEMFGSRVYMQIATGGGGVWGSINVMRMVNGVVSYGFGKMEILKIRGIADIDGWNCGRKVVRGGMVGVENGRLIVVFGAIGEFE
eukprot:5637933-Karenia_brevis.AAC.1